MTDDCISRQAVLEQIKGWLGYELKDMTNPIYYLEKRIKALPPVNPQEPKTGHWINDRNKNNVRCCVCGRGYKDVSATASIMSYNYCPNCGCRMVEPQESEDKE